MFKINKKDKICLICRIKTHEKICSKCKKTLNLNICAIIDDLELQGTVEQKSLSRYIYEKNYELFESQRGSKTK